MKDLIKAIRSAANMNQEQFASTLGTTALSINRWENGKTIPNKMAQTQIYNFCKNRAIDVTKLIIDTKAYGNNDNRLILYHGSKKGITGDISPISRSECDFGRGFYMGTNTLQSIKIKLDCIELGFVFVANESQGLKRIRAHIEASTKVAFATADR